jgi:hypothetical protein
MFALLSLPPPILPNAFLYEIVYACILAIVLALVATFSSLRRRQFALVLILIGFVEFAIILNTRFTVPIEALIISFVTIISGILVPIFYITRRQLIKTKVKLFLILSGCTALLLGVISLSYIDVWGYFDGNVFVILRVNEELLLLGIVLVAVGIYFVIIGTAMFLIKPRTIGPSLNTKAYPN